MVITICIVKKNRKKKKNNTIIAIIRWHNLMRLPVPSNAIVVIPMKKRAARLGYNGRVRIEKRDLEAAGCR